MYIGSIGAVVDFIVIFKGFMLFFFFTFILFWVPFPFAHNIVNWISGEKGQHKNATHCHTQKIHTCLFCHLPSNVCLDSAHGKIEIARDINLCMSRHIVLKCSPGTGK